MGRVGRWYTRAGYNRVVQAGESPTQEQGVHWAELPLIPRDGQQECQEYRFLRGNPVPV